MDKAPQEITNLMYILKESKFIERSWVFLMSLQIEIKQ